MFIFDLIQSDNQSKSAFLLGLSIFSKFIFPILILTIIYYYYA